MLDKTKPHPRLPEGFLAACASQGFALTTHTDYHVTVRKDGVFLASIWFKKSQVKAMLNSEAHAWPVVNWTELAESLTDEFNRQMFPPAYREQA
jgi:hypothetical protein